MARAAPRVCGHCGGVHQKGERCPKVAMRDRERKARADAKRPNARARGYDREWEKARADWLAAYPSCVRCGAKATLVDHIIPIRKAPHRRLDRTNFQSLCTPCHSGAKQSQERKT
jgi:HNH endonuclease.